MSGVDLTVVVLSWNTRGLTLACLGALARDETRLAREVIVVDNGSKDSSPDAIEREYPNVTLIRNTENRLYAEANNQGARAGSGRWLCILNSDTEVDPGSLDALVAFLEHNPEYGAAGPRLVWPDGRVQRACNRFPNLIDPLVDSTALGRFPPGSWWAARTRMFDFEHLESRDVDQPPGACMLLGRAEFLELGGLDPRLSLFFNDVDLCKALASRGRRIRYMAEVNVLHHAGASTRTLPEVRSLWTRNRMAFYRKHYGRAAVGYLYAILFVEAARVWLGIKLGRRAPEQKREALEDLRIYLRGAMRGPSNVSAERLRERHPPGKQLR